MHALVLADGHVAPRVALDGAWPGWSDGIGLVVAADGGVRHAATLGVGVDRWVGDGDSAAPDDLAHLARLGVSMERADRDKDRSDTELAVIAALTAGATRLTIVGALGGPRIDHALANVALLALDALRGLDVRLVAADARIRLVRAPGDGGRAVTADLDGRIGDIVSLLPWGGHVDGVTTAGLRYPLHDEALLAGPARGLSNVRVTSLARVTVRLGALVVIEVPASLSG
jgi:thiamine pyrophosphokinase